MMADWDWEYVTRGFMPATAQPVDPEQDTDTYPKATLWLPSPENDSGWAMRHVWGEKPGSPRPRRIGFGSR